MRKINVNFNKKCQKLKFLSTNQTNKYGGGKKSRAHGVPLARLQPGTNSHFEVVNEAQHEINYTTIQGIACHMIGLKQES